MNLKTKFKLKPFVTKHKKTITTTAIVLLITVPFLSILLPSFIDYYYEEPKGKGDQDIDSLLWQFSRGLPGTGATMQPEKVRFTTGGEEYIVVGTDGGIATITLDGLIATSYATFGDVIDFELINDISGDGSKDIVLITYDRQHPNVIAIDSSNGRELWKYAPKVTGYDPETYDLREFITYTWDIEVIDDITDDHIQDVVISSWYRIIALEGEDGDEIWINEDACTNDIWNIELLDDKIIAGSEAGELVAVNKDDGELEWISEVKPTTTVLLRSLTTVIEREIPSSINDIIIIGSDILVSSDNGFLYTISGDDGAKNDEYELYEIPEYDDYVGSTTDVLTSPYSVERRIFQRAGLKLFNTIDINGDGVKEFMAIAFHLEYSEENFHSLEDIKFEGILFDCDGDDIDVISSGEFDYDIALYTASYPEFVNVDSTIRGYFYRNNFESASGQASNSQGIYYTNYIVDSLSSVKSTRIVRTGDVWEDEADDDDTVGKYVLNLGDVNNDKVDDLFAISDDGRYFLIDTKNGQTIWSRTKASGKTELVRIQDIDKDGVRDFLFKRVGDFDPVWRDYEDNQIDVPSWNRYEFAREGDPAENQDIIVEFLAISARTSRVLWEFSVPNPDYYEGLREVVNIGDVDNDNIDDFCGWIIPSDYPSEISQHIRDISGSSTVSVTSYDNARNNYVEDALNMALLVKYTKVLAISGSNGSIFWNSSLIDFPYKYYREFYYGGAYENPINSHTTNGFIYHRTYDGIPSSWHNPSDINDIYWENIWDSSSLTHATNAEVESGTTTDSFLELFGDKGDNHTITVYNASGSVLIGNALTSSSEETKEKDNYLWTVNSESSSGAQRISLEMSFVQSLEAYNRKPDYLLVDYAGNLSSQVSQISISIYNVSQGWVKISSNNINSTNLATMIKQFNVVDDYIINPNNNLVKLRIDAITSSSFSLNVDELVVKYIYKLKTYSVISEKIGTQWQTLINFTIPLEFGEDFHALSQIDRISALRLQTNALVNISASYRSFNFTYEIYNPITSKWDSFAVNPNNRLLGLNFPTNAWHGGFKNSTTGGYRNDDNSFNLTNSFRNDIMYVIARGTKNPSGLFGIDDGIEFDYENKTFISNYTTNNNFLFRINITNGIKPFNLTLDSFGISVFYWGVFGNEYDQYYVYDLVNTKWDINLNNIINLKIQDFVAINGTSNGNHRDVLVVIGFETNGVWSSRLSLFDVKNRKVTTQWGYNCRNKIPFNIVRATYLNSSQNGWILSGTFEIPFYTQFSHKFIDDPYWDNTITNYDNYSSPLISYRSCSINITDQSWSFYEVPGTTPYKVGSLGIILGTYNSQNSNHQTIKIIDSQSLSTVCIINPINLDKLGVENRWITINDFSSTGAGYKLRLSYADFNGDGYLEHVGLANRERVVKIFNGQGTSGDAIVDIDLEELIGEGEVSNKYYDWSEDVETSFTLPFASVGDLNEDNVIDGIVGLQITKSDWDDNLYAKGAAVLCLDIRESSGLDLMKIDVNQNGDSNENNNGDDDDEENGGRGFNKNAWQLEPYEFGYEWSEDQYEYFDFMENVGDLNGDHYDDVICGHKIYDSAEGAYNTRQVTDLLDVYNQELLYRFNLESIDTIYTIGDLNGDKKDEFVIVNDETFYCVNSEFNVEFSNVEDGDKMTSNRFTLEWETEADYDHFELLIDGTSYNITEYMQCKVFSGPGEKKIQLFMYDKSGLVIAVDEITITVPADYAMWIITFMAIALIAASFIAYKRYKKKIKMRQLIEDEKKVEVFK